MNYCSLITIQIIYYYSPARVINNWSPITNGNWACGLCLLSIRNWQEPNELAWISTCDYLDIYSKSDHFVTLPWFIPEGLNQNPLWNKNSCYINLNLSLNEHFLLYSLETQINTTLQSHFKVYASVKHFKTKQNNIELNF